MSRAELRDDCSSPKVRAETFMRHGHGTTSDKPKEKLRRHEQGARDMAKEEQNRQRSKGGGQPNKAGIAPGQNGEETGTSDPRAAYARGGVRH
jgi:hypothetical protein